MKRPLTRRHWLTTLGSALAGVMSLALARKAKAAVQKVLASAPAPKGYDPAKHRWLMQIDVDRCIGCGLCVEACKTENHVPPEPTYFRTWVERYIVKKPKPGSDTPRGEVVVDSPNGGMHFSSALVPREEIMRSFFVPKLCNLCEHSPCSQVCPVGATFETPDGVVLVDPKYCIGCGFCVQACPYGCRFLNPITHTAEKCTLCYHRITRGLRPACVEVCPGEARIFGDLKNPVANDPIQRFIATKRVMALKPYLGTGPRVLYAGLDEEVR
ncbi:MAG: 4Fe-4S dicluster domain-containing protein [Verrucomicrobia bacterium]|nr:4Fe-4S dicluster domain-containing protein [Verrucomicrobiota bacterium]